MNPSLQLMIVIIALLQLPTGHASSLPSKGLGIEKKTRLGSTPPSCHRKCYECYPCFAVQVPALPIHDPFAPSLDRVGNAHLTLMEFYDLHGNRYSNYKPLEWKCRCNDHFFNP